MRSQMKLREQIRFGLEVKLLFRLIGWHSIGKVWPYFHMLLLPRGGQSRQMYSNGGCKCFVTRVTAAPRSRKRTVNKLNCISWQVYVCMCVSVCLCVDQMAPIFVF